MEKMKFDLSKYEAIHGKLPEYGGRFYFIITPSNDIAGCRASRTTELWRRSWDEVVEYYNTYGVCYHGKTLTLCPDNTVLQP